MLRQAHGLCAVFVPNRIAPATFLLPYNMAIIAEGLFWWLGSVVFVVVLVTHVSIKYFFSVGGTWFEWWAAASAFCGLRLELLSLVRVRCGQGYHVPSSRADRRAIPTNNSCLIIILIIVLQINDRRNINNYRL